MVGAVLVKGGRLLGAGWHRRAGEPHSEIEALRDAANRGNAVRDATLFVTLEPCCSHGRTPPCTTAILGSGVGRVVVGATDPNPRHSGRAFALLRRGGIKVSHGILEAECSRLNEGFNHWIVHGTPFVTVKSAMTLDGKIATASGESQWITSEAARRHAMRIRRGTDAILCGINTVLADDPSLTVRIGRSPRFHQPLRIILDSRGRIPLDARVLTDSFSERTVIVVSRKVPARRQRVLETRSRVLISPREEITLPWLLKHLGREEITSLLVEGGGEVASSFIALGLVQRILFYYAPKVMGGRDARRALAGQGAIAWREVPRLNEIQWQRVGPDLVMSARVIGG
jgi:diaminohydroxyphosphoribosylaminopyrimidine deaminase/5-amino-6-(5-phosphoribosylamino)uracil reductase